MFWLSAYVAEGSVQTEDAVMSRWTAESGTQIEMPFVREAGEGGGKCAQTEAGGGDVHGAGCEESGGVAEVEVCGVHEEPARDGVSRGPCGSDSAWWEERGRKLAVAMSEMQPEEGILYADGFDEAFIGWCWDTVNGVYRACYSYQRCVDLLVARDGMEAEDALEWMDFNVVGAYVGPRTPVYVDFGGFGLRGEGQE